VADTDPTGGAVTVGQAPDGHASDGALRFVALPAVAVGADPLGEATSLDAAITQHRPDLLPFGCVGQALAEAVQIPLAGTASDPGERADREDPKEPTKGFDRAFASDRRERGKSSVTKFLTRFTGY
jgi:hypothetical protein